jgi:predicted O-methyltransferase YrrM
MPDAAFPNMIVGDTSVPRWPYLRRWVEQNWYTDRRNPDAGFINRDEASILYNSALLFRGKPCLEVGSWRGWSTVHLALGSGMLDIIDPLLGNPDFAESITGSCAAAGVLDKVSFHPGESPQAIHTLAQSSGKRWSLIFIDADHEGDAPRLDAEAARLYTADTAMMLFHDLASPYVAAGLDAMRNAGWRTMVYQTMQIMGVAWRGNVRPIAHVPDPKVFWTLPRHLSGYEVSGWQPPALPADGAAWAGMTMEDRRNAAMLRAQTAEDDLAAARAARDLAQEQGDAAAAARAAAA